jgi:hypothetical protein
MVVGQVVFPARAGTMPFRCVVEPWRGDARG